MRSPRCCISRKRSPLSVHRITSAMAGQSCPYGSERKPGSPSYWLLRQSDVFAGRAGQRFGASQTPYGLISAGLTDTLCAGSPESEFMPERFPGDPAAAVFNNAVVRLWNSYCRCSAKKSPPPFTGGQCPVQYRVTSVATYQWYNPPFDTRTSTRTGVGFGPLKWFARYEDKGVFEYDDQLIRSRDNQDLAGSASLPAKPGTTRVQFTIVRVDGQPDNCGSPPPVKPDQYPPPTVYVGSPVFQLPEVQPDKPCDCFSDGLTVLGGGASFPENYLKDLQKFAELLKNLPKVLVPRPDWMPKGLADYFNAVNLLSWMKFVEPERKMDANCCNVILAKLQAVETRGNLTGEEVAYIKAFVEKMYVDSGNDRRDILAFLRPIASQVFRIDSIVKQLPSWNTGVQNGLSNIFNRQAAYQNEVRQNFLTVGAALGAAAVAAAVAAAATAKTLAVLVAQGASTQAQLVALRGFLEVFRQALQVQLNAISDGIKNEVRFVGDNVRNGFRSTEILIGQVRTDLQDLLSILQARLNQLGNFIERSSNTILGRIDLRSNEIKALINSLINGINQLIVDLGNRLAAIEKSIASILDKFREVLAAIAGLRTRMDARFDGLVECLDTSSMKFDTAVVIGSGISGSVALPARTIGVTFRAVGAVPSDKTKRQSGNGQPDVIQGGWCWVSYNGLLGTRQPLDAVNKLFLLSEFSRLKVSGNIVWTGSNLITYEVSAIIAPEPKKPPFGERPCQ